MDKDISKFDKKHKFDILSKILNGPAEIMQEPKTKEVTIKKGRNKYFTDVFSLEDFLLARKQQFVYKKQKKPKRLRKIEIIKLFE